MPRVAAAAHGFEKAEALVQTMRDFGQPQHPGPGGGELDGKGNTVEPAADLHDERSRLVIEHKSWIGCSRPGNEERHRWYRHGRPARQLVAVDGGRQRLN